MKFVEEFKAFALKGNVIDMAVGVIIGGAFGKIVSSVVANIIMPPIGVLVGGVDFTKLSVTIKDAVPAVLNEAGEEIEAAKEAVTLNYGQFLQDAEGEYSFLGVSTIAAAIMAGMYRNLLIAFLFLSLVTSITKSLTQVI